DMAAEPLPIAGDATLLRQVVHNLLQNALDAVGQSDDAQVSLSTCNTLSDDAQVSLSTCSTPDKVLLVVQDNGPGIPEDLRKRVFEPYVTTKAKGTGLGLAIVKKIVEEHHGKVRIRNVDPHGARIEVELPLTGAAIAG
ncbi:MAG: sensor histidine kinase, partial [Burkholderiales bacterium]